MIQLLQIAERFSLREEISTQTLKAFIEKYAKTEQISPSIADIIKMRFSLILEDAQKYLKEYNRQINSLYL